MAAAAMLYTLSHSCPGAPLFIGVSILCSLSARVGPRACGGRPAAADRSQTPRARPALRGDEPANGVGPPRGVPSSYPPNPPALI
jgi:hypothetical protein